MLIRSTTLAVILAATAGTTAFAQDGLSSIGATFAAVNRIDPSDVWRADYWLSVEQRRERTRLQQEIKARRKEVTQTRATARRERRSLTDEEAAQVAALEQEIGEARSSQQRLVQSSRGAL